MSRHYHKWMPMHANGPSRRFDYRVLEVFWKWSEPDTIPPRKEAVTPRALMCFVDMNCHYASLKCVVDYRIQRTVFFLVFLQRSVTSGGKSTIISGTVAGCAKPWLGRKIVMAGGMSHISRRIEVGNTTGRTFNTRLSSGTFFLFFGFQKPT